MTLSTDLSQKRETRSFKKQPRKLALSAERLDCAEVVSRKLNAAFIDTACHAVCVCVQSRFLVRETSSDSENRCLLKSLVTAISVQCARKWCLSYEKPAEIAVGH